MSKSNPTAKEKVQKWMDDAIKCHKRLSFGPYGLSDSSIINDNTIHVSYDRLIKMCRIMDISRIAYVIRYTEEELAKNPDNVNYLYEASIMYKGWKFFGILSKRRYEEENIKRC